MKVFDNEKGVRRRFKPISFEYVEKGKRIIKGQIIDKAKDPKKWEEKESTWNEELKVWTINN